MKLVNFTPHEIIVFDENNSILLRIPPSGKIARVSTKQVVVGHINTKFRDNEDNDIVIPIVKTEFGEVILNDKPFNDGETFICSNCKCFINNGGECAGATVKSVEQCEYQEPIDYYIVSSLVAQALKGRNDIIAPDTSPSGVVRDENGNIIGVKRFQRW